MKKIFFLPAAVFSFISLIAQKHVGIGTTNPLAALHVADSSVLFTGPAILPVIATPPPVSGAGNRMFWYADNAAFRAGHVANTNWDINNVGQYSFATGYDTKASGFAAYAIGQSTIASGNYATAMGYLPTASGLVATAMGENTLASGGSSLATGNSTLASGYASTAFGSHTNATGVNALAAGNTNIAAGINSIAAGNNSNAVGDNSFSIGHYARAIGEKSFALGDSVRANGYAAIAIGYKSIADGEKSFAAGDSAIAYGYASTAMGVQSTASGEGSTAMGYQTSASSFYSTAMGEQSTASGEASIAMGGQTQAISNYSTAMGFHTIASGFATTAMGSMVSTDGHMGSFIIGDANILANTNCFRNNEFRARFDGGYALYTNAATTTGVFMLNGANAWSSISDSTKKEKFIKTDGEYVLKSISKMRLGSWNYKFQNAQSFRHYGPMAQEFYKAFGNDGIGKIGCDTLINSADIDGVMMIGLQALEKRSSIIIKENAELKADNLALQKEMAEIKEQYTTTNVQLTDKIAVLETRLNQLLAVKEQKGATKEIVINK